MQSVCRLELSSFNSKNQEHIFEQKKYSSFSSHFRIAGKTGGFQNSSLQSMSR